METKLKIKGNWNTLKADLKKKYPKLTDEDLHFTAGKEDEMLARLERRLGKTKDEISDTIDELQLESNPSERSHSGSEQKERSHSGGVQKEKTHSGSGQKEPTKKYK